MRKKDTMTHEDYSTPVLGNIDSNRGLWPTPEEEKWTMVERSHGSLRSAKDINSDQLYNSGDKLDHSGMRCRQLDYIDRNANRCTSSKVWPTNRKEATQNDRSPTRD